MATDAREKWFRRLKRCLKDMPEDVELLVSGYGVVSMLPAGSIDAYSTHQHGMDRIAEETAISEFTAKRVTGENSTI